MNLKLCDLYPQDLASLNGRLPVNPAVGYMVTLPLSQNTYSEVITAVWDGKSWKVCRPRERWKLFLDDLRGVASVGWTILRATHTESHVRVARTVAEAKALIEKHGVPIEISFDHDLGGDAAGDGGALMWWLINGHLDGAHDCAEIKLVQVHSANAVGAENLMRLWQGFCTEMDLSCEIRRVHAEE